MSNQSKEHVKKRKSYYGFSKEYPGRIGKNGYAIGDTVTRNNKERVRKIIIALLIVLLFIVSFVVTSVGLHISSEKPESEKNLLTVPQAIYLCDNIQ
jgi:hypothetical protein